MSQDDDERQESDWESELMWLDLQRFRLGAWPGTWWRVPYGVPRRQPGDGWIILGALIGTIMGGVTGGAIGVALGSLFTGAFIGVMVGSIAGTLLGDRAKKSHARP